MYRPTIQHSLRRLAQPAGRRLFATEADITQAKNYCVAQIA